MDQDIIRENMKRLRITRDLKQEDVARDLNITTAVYRNIETGKTPIQKDLLDQIADYYGVSASEFVDESRQLEFVRFRDHKKLKSRNQILVAVANKLDEYAELEQLLEKKEKPWELGKLTGTYDELAIEVRQIFGLNSTDGKEEKPVTNICTLLGQHGVKVIPITVRSYDFFGLSVDEKDRGGPSIIVNVWERIPVERWIFSAVHELGHLLRHKTSYKISNDALNEKTKEEEKEANQFASLLLMPEKLFKQELKNAYGLTLLETVFKLKSFFNVSYKAVLYRLSQMGWDDIWRDFQLEYRKRTGKTLPGNVEPNPLEPKGFGFELYTTENVAQEPKRLDEIEFTINEEFCRMVRQALLTEKITRGKAANMLNITIEELGERIKVWTMQEKLLAK